MKFENTDSMSTDGHRVHKTLQTTYEAFRAGDFVLAEETAEKALATDFENPDVITALKCAVFWKDRVLRLASFQVPEERGDYLLREFQGFQKRFSVHFDSPFAEGVQAILQFAHQAAAAAYQEQMAYAEGAEKTALLLKIAKVFKSNGDFDQAAAALDEVLQLQKDDAEALAEMGDCFEMMNESRKARLYFREAFYINAQKVDLDHLSSAMIKAVVKTVEDAGYTLPELKEWVPVYAVIQGVFSVKRELKPLELGHLKQSINALKSEYLDGTGSQAILVPRLINRYFWLIDHYLSVKEERNKIEDVLLNIKLLSQPIYELYTH